MEQRIRILGIAPYENMKTMMQEVVEQYPQIALNVFVGDLEEGVELARRNFYNDYDVIISRGGTAELLRKNLDLPVIEIKMSQIDILRAMKLAEHVSDHYAIVGFSNITVNARYLCQMMQYKADIYTIQNENEVERTLYQIQSQGTGAILCDMVTNTIAKRLGLNVILMSSGAESIREAFEDAIRLCGNYRSLREENQFLRDVIWNQMNHTLVFNKKGEIFFSTLEKNNIPIVDYLRQESALITGETTQHMLKQINHVQYSIRANRRTLGNMEYVACYFSESRAPASGQQRGIRYMNSSEAREEYNASLYGLTGLLHGMQEILSRIGSSGQPVMVWGEEGICKEQLVNYLYTGSYLSNRPMALIDCFQLNERTWNYLMDNCNSPLMQKNCTLFIKNVDALSGEQCRNMLSGLLAMDIQKRNQIFFSCTCGEGKTLTENGMKFVEKLECIPVRLAPLREQASQMPAAANMYISYLNTTMAKQIMGLEPEAVRLLERFAWPGNHAQFRRVLKELSVRVRTPYITAEAVEQILKREQEAVRIKDKAEGAGRPLDLNRTLDAIDREIILRVLEEENGNQSSTARRLGISRTTLWRFLNGNG